MAKSTQFAKTALKEKSIPINVSNAQLSGKEYVSPPQ